MAQQLDMPLLTLDVSHIFKQKVKDYLYKEYIQGCTPNPCVQCNKFIKFSIMLKEAQKLGIYYIASGHYACIEFNDKIQEYVIKKPLAIKKIKPICFII
ncbi:MAG: hypothetical protein MJA31_20970 [Clostridia bacterium]|nr:hypothetical protein [Clostridia bacterium]